MSRGADTRPVAPDAEQRLFRLLLRASRRGAVLQDHIDCADFAQAADLRDTAAMLYGLAALRMGFAPETLNWLADADRGVGFWGSAEPAARRSGQAADAVDIAIQDLARLMQSDPSLGELAGPARPRTAGVATALPRAADIRTDVMPLADRARALLSSTLLAEDMGGLVSQLRGIADVLIALEPVSLEEHLDASHHEWVSLFALEQLRRFVSTNMELLGAIAEPSLFEQAARLSQASLGPYFSNVWRLIRTPRDILALIDAASGGKADEEQTSIWCILLSIHLREHELVGLIDELGDRGMIGTLRTLLVRLERAGFADPAYDSARRIRDVCLDIGDFALALQAQALIASWQPNESRAWEALGEIQASAGAQDRADEALGRALLLDSGNQTALRKRAALQAGALLPLQHGYFSSTGRARLRRARLRALAAN